LETLGCGLALRSLYVVGVHTIELIPTELVELDAALERAVGACALAGTDPVEMVKQRLGSSCGITQHCICVRLDEKR
jgi:hypothetical protein